MNLIYCPNCGNALNQGDSFCSNCGANLADYNQDAIQKTTSLNDNGGNNNSFNYNTNDNSNYGIKANDAYTNKKRNPNKSLTAVIIALSVLLVVLIITLVIFLLGNKNNQNNNLSVSDTSSTTEVPVSETTVPEKTDEATQPTVKETTRPYVPAVAVEINDYYYINTNKSSLNIRSGAGTDFKVIGSVPKGATVYVYEIIGEWARISYNGIVGWVAAGYLSYGSGYNYAPSYCGYYIVSTNKSSLNIRSGAGTGYKVIGSVPKGAVVYVYQFSSGWAKISYNGTVGWVSDSYLTYYQ